MTPRQEGLQVLGTLCAMSNQSSSERRHRIAKAWHCFYAHTDLWDNLQSTRLQRANMLESLVGPSLVYGCQVWNPVNRDLRALRGAGQKMCGMVMNLLCVHGDTPVQYVRRRKRFIRTMREQCNLPEWDAVCRRRQWWFASKFFFSIVLTIP